MIKTPVHAATELDDEDDIVYTGEIYDEDGNSVCLAEIDFVDEIVKRINMHGDLINAVKELLNIINSLVDEESLTDCYAEIVTGDFVIDTTRAKAEKLLKEC